MPTDKTPSTTRMRREIRHMRLLHLGYRDYPHYLRSAHWADKRREYRESGLPQDCFCGETKAIQLHHMTYERIGREELSDLTPVCPPCHAMIHALANRGEIGLDFTGFVNEQRAAVRRAEVERAAQEKELGFFHALADFEDIRRRSETLLLPLAKSAPGTARERAATVHDVYLMLSACQRIETRLERAKQRVA